MRNRQSGVSLLALIAILIVVAVIALFGMKVIPSFLEFRAAKNAIEAIARERQGSSPTDIRRAFENRSAIDDINTIKPSDLDIGKDGNATVISFAYRKEVPLFKNVGLYIDYAASAGGQ
jgi:Tfp pilus assembly protein FimT